MPAQSTLALNGLRLGLLGTAADLAIAAPLLPQNYSPAAHTDAARIGAYFDRTVTVECMGFVVMGTESFRVTASGVRVFGSLVLDSQSANQFFASPDGGAGSPVFRSLATGDLPNTAVTAASYGSASGVGTFTVDAKGRLTAAATVAIAISASAITSGILTTVRGGTGVDGSAAANGQLLIGNGAGYSLSTITAGAGISVVNGAGTITIAALTSGTVTSIDVAVPAFMTSVGGPVTTSGTITLAFTSQAANLMFASPDGGAGVPTFRAIATADLPNTAVTAAAYGSASSIGTFTVDAKGRLTAAATVAVSITASQVSDFNTAVNGRSLSVFSAPTAGISWGGFGITNLLDPVNPQDAATKNYVDAVAQGLDIKASCRLATTAALPAATYANGAAGVGATLTATANGALSVDGTAVGVNDRILVKNQAAGLQNGIYAVTDAGSAGTPYILTRATDIDQSTEMVSAFVFIETGTVNLDTGWVCTTDSPITVGTTVIAFSQFSGAGSYLAGVALDLTGNTFDVRFDSSTININGSNQLRVANGGITTTQIAAAAVNLATQVTGVLPIANGGTGLSTTAANGQLLIGNGAGYSLSTITAGAGISVVNGAGTITIAALTSGTVTSIDVAVPGYMTSAGGPVTSSGTITLAFASQAANLMFASPDGSAGVPTFRSIATADLPNTAVTPGAYGAAASVGTFTVDAKGRLTAAADVAIAISATAITSGILAVARGGTGTGTVPTNGQLLIGNGTGYAVAALTAGTGISITNGAGTITIATNDVAQTSALVLGDTDFTAFLVDNFYGGVIELDVYDNLGAVYNTTLSINHNGTTGADATVVNWTEHGGTVTGTILVTFSAVLSGAGAGQIVNVRATASATGWSIRWRQRLL